MPETHRVARFGIDDGLSQSSVTALAQDRRGLLWAGTFDGLNRYDGYEFRTHRVDSDDPDSLDDAHVTAVAAHPDGSVWVGTIGGGLARHDPLTENFSTLRAGTGSALGSDYIEAIAVDHEGGVWVGTTMGLAHASAKSSVTLRFQRISGDPISSLAPRAAGGVWVGRADGTLELRNTPGSGATGIYRQVSPFPAPSPSLRAIAPTPDGGAWISADDRRFARLAPDGTVRSHHSVPESGSADAPRLRALVAMDDDRLWLGGLAMGVVLFSARSNRVVRTWRHQPFDPYSLRHDDVASLWFDDARTLWIGTLSGGLNSLRVDGSGFAHYRHQPANPTSLSHNTITAFAADPGGYLWVGTDGDGLNRFDLSEGRFTRVPLSPSRMSVAGSNRIWSLHVDRGGSLWVGTWGAGLLRRAAGRTEFLGIPAVAAPVVSAFAENPSGIWVGTSNGALHFSLSGRLLARAFDGLRITTLELLPDGRLAAGTWASGLHLLDPDSGATTVFRHAPADARSLPHDSVRDLALQRDGSLWVATAAGIARLTTDDGRFERAGGQTPFLSGVVYGIEIDDADFLWLSTNNGLVRFDALSGAARRYLPDDGIQDFEFNGGAHLRLADGRMLFGGINGFNLFDPRRITRTPDPAPPRIVDILIANRVAQPMARDPNSPLPVAAPELRALTLGPRHDVLGLRFASPLPISPSQLRYAYRLDGFDEGWQEPEPGQRLATYTRLPAGHYTFRVRAAGAGGDWSDAGQILQLRILPPWWASAWAYALYAAAALFALFAFIRWRTREPRLRAALLETRVAERTSQLAEQSRVIEDQARHLQVALAMKERFFARVSHEFRTPLTLIMGPIEALLVDERRGRTAAWLRLMRRNARRLLSLVDQLLGLAQVSGEAPLQTHPLCIAPLVRDTVSAFESMAVTKGVHLALGDLDDAWVAATPELLERMITNLVSNAVKFTPRGGHVAASVTNEGAMVALRVTDDGPGIPPEEQEAIFEPFHRIGDGGNEGTGIGLALVRECAQALGGSAGVQSAPCRGAVFTIRLPACPPGRESADVDDQESAPSARMLLEAEVHRDAPTAAEARALMTGRGMEHGNVEDERPRVLIVEDNADLRLLLLSALSRAYRCATAGNGRTGIVAAIEDPPDLIISDVLMPEADGFELTRILKVDPRSSHVPIVLLTALGDRDSRLHGLEERADDYLVKPFDADELRLRVRNLIDARQIARQRAALTLPEEARPSAGTTSSAVETHSPRERAFLERLRAAAQAGHADAAFGVTELAGRVAMSERQLQRKLKALLGVSPADYLRELRLQQAAALLRGGKLPGNVAFTVGFSSAAHFGACFKARYGATPGEWAMTGRN